MSRYISKIKNLEEIEIKDNLIWKKFLDKYKGNNICIKKNIKNFVKTIFSHLEEVEYNNSEMECLLDWMCDQFIYSQNLTEDEKNLIYQFVTKYPSWKRNIDDEKLNNIILNSPSTKCDMVVYRGSRDNYFFNPKRFNDGIYTADQVTSTSFDLKSAYKFTGIKNKCCLLIMELPKGSKGLILFPEVIETYFRKESEFILPIGNKLKFVNQKNLTLQYPEEYLKIENLLVTFWEGISNTEMNINLINKFCNNPCKETFISLPEYIQKMFIIVSKNEINQGKGNQNLMKKILEYNKEI